MVEKNRLVRKILIVCIIGCSLCGAVVLGMRLFYHAFYNNAQREFLLPALEDGFVPQGLAYCEEYDLFLISGYIYGEENARICVVEDEEYRVISLMDEKGNELISHSGAIAYGGNYVYLASCDGMCFMEGNVVMSASSVFQGSQLYVYDWEKAMLEQADALDVGVYDVPLYYLDVGTLLDCVEILPKSEGITMCDDKLYMIFESASERFRYGKLLGCEYAYSLPTEYFEISH